MVLVLDVHARLVLDAYVPFSAGIRAARGEGGGDGQGTITDRDIIGAPGISTPHRVDVPIRAIAKRLVSLLFGSEVVKVKGIVRG